VYDRRSETFQSLCRVMSGFSDGFYEAATARLGATAIPGPKPYYATGERPSVWFEPTEVWEVRGADLSISPVHKAAVGQLHADRGVGLRFPRFLGIRPDKSPEDASGPELIVQLYGQQSRRVHRQEEAEW
jgi:DNA ligase-1